MLEITDVTGQRIWVRPGYLIAVLMPSLLLSGPSTARIVFVGGVLDVTRDEATRILEALRASDGTADLHAVMAMIT